MGAIMQYKSTWGSAASAGVGVDQVRSDLFMISLAPPPILGSSNFDWTNQIQFTVSKFAFPNRERDMIPIKYLNQTNFQVGAETPLAPVSVTVRYPFNYSTATMLEQWHWATSNPNGAVALTSTIKTNGTATWLAPVSEAALNFDASNPLAVAQTAYQPMAQGGYYLEGCLIKALKPSDADMEATGTGALVHLEFMLQMDRYYPLDTRNLTLVAS